MKLAFTLIKDAITNSVSLVDNLSPYIRILCGEVAVSEPKIAYAALAVPDIILLWAGTTGLF